MDKFLLRIVNEGQETAPYTLLNPGERRLVDTLCAVCIMNTPLKNRFGLEKLRNDFAASLSGFYDEGGRAKSILEMAKHRKIDTSKPLESPSLPSWVQQLGRLERELSERQR